ncbi:glutathione S-transferase [uncultured Xylophilus sp.]|uniref:glutathione S-transferase family protein n=1 Tax=uncultured Xylophilus sp. TaxID=296832 RepID=UPI0025D59A3A|nr:glutathione S-transferase [uncultured Xylophilus sp.]
MRPSPKIFLHHCVGARSFRPLWLLEELQAPYALAMLPFPPRARARDYLARNPLGTVPLLEDGDVRMTESAAMCQYLPQRCDPDHRHGLAVRPDEPGYAAWLDLLHHGEATLTFPQTLVLRYRHFETPERRLPQAADDYEKWFLARLRGIDARLAGRNGDAGDAGWLCAGRFTAADVSVGYALMLGDFLGLEPRYPQAVQRYWARLQQRDGYRRALAAERAAAIAQGVSPRPAPQVLDAA